MHIDGKNLYCSVLHCPYTVCCHRYTTPLHWTYILLYSVIIIPSHPSTLCILKVKESTLLCRTILCCILLLLSSSLLFFTFSLFFNLNESMKLSVIFSLCLSLSHCLSLSLSSSLSLFLLEWLFKTTNDQLPSRVKKPLLLLPAGM